MGWLKKKPDPLTERSRALNAEISALEAEIRKLDTQLQTGDGTSRLRSTVRPQSPVITYSPSLDSSVATPEKSAPTPAEPIFEPVDRQRLKPRTEADETAAHYNELGVRKYDLPALLRRLRNHFRGPSTTNPKLVSYLAAGGIQGLRPLRYEKRVARNRFIALVILLFLALLGIISTFLRHH